MPDAGAEAGRDATFAALQLARQEADAIAGLLDGRETHTGKVIVDELARAGLTAVPRGATGELVFHDAHGAVVGPWVLAVVHVVNRERELLGQLDEDRRDET